MSENNSHAETGSVPASAIVLCGERATAEDRNLVRFLDFFAVPWKVVTASNPDEDGSQGPYAILGSADSMAEAIQDAQGPDGALPSWVRKATAAYLYGFEGNERSTKLLRFLTGNQQATLRPVPARETVMSVATSFPTMCGSMSGLQVPVTPREPGWVCDLGAGGEAFQSVIRANDGEVFFGVVREGVRFYINAWSGILDISALSAQYFDVKKFFCEAVPPVLYLKWAFRDAACSLNETNACLIVDDPPLKRRYGFLDYAQAMQLMDGHNFSTTIAFIPWNWRRTDPGTLRLFQSRPERLSLVFHGCDHTASEFAERSPVLLNRKIHSSRQRMECFRRRAAIKAESVMVFPQGEFSPETGRALKLNGFVAAVNTEVAPADKAANETTIADLWNVAIMKYGTFPIFTRRYASHGIENFAFDGLLGKPCLIAAHHDVFRNGGRDLVDLVARLNSLKWNLVWRPLGEAVRRSFAIRRLPDGGHAVQMFAGSLVVENSDGEPREILLLKEEGDPDCVQAVWVNQQRVDFGVEDRHLRVRLTVSPGETALVRVGYRNDLEAVPQRNSSRARIKIAANRYLSEFRDNYLSRSDFIYQSAYRLKRLVR